MASRTFKSGNGLYCFEAIDTTVSKKVLDNMGMCLVGFAKIWFYTLCPDRPEGVRAGMHRRLEWLAETSFQGGLAGFYKVIWS